jgi:CAAX amino terminal protease family protein
MLKNYNRPWFFFSVSIIIPWVLWFSAGYLSHRTDSENHIWLQSMLMLSGLLAPIFTALFLYLKNPILLQDLKNKFFHFEKKTWIYLILSIVVPFGSIILAQLISVFF